MIWGSIGFADISGVGGGSIVCGLGADWLGSLDCGGDGCGLSYA